jgi:hypothetical protein
MAVREQVEAAMQDSRRTAALHAALRFVVISDTLSEHKAILIEALTQTLRADAAVEHSQRQVAQAAGEWQDHEVAQMKSFLHDQPAKSWQHADECVMHLAAQLHRDPRAVRDKATQLGLGASVDFRFAKALQQARSE